MMDMKCCASLCVAALAIGLPAAALGAGFQNSGQSATATGMAFTGVANPDEPNTSFYNPATMGFQEDFKLYLGDTIIAPSTSFESAGEGSLVETNPQIFPPPNVHLAYHDIAESGVSVGAGVTFPYGLGIAWPDEWEGRTNIKSQDLTTTNFNPNVAYRIPGVDLSVALGAQIVSGTVEFEQSIETRDDEYVEAQLGGTGMGFGATAAAMYQPMEDLTLGLQYRSRVTVDYDEASVHFDGEENTGFYQTFRDNPASTEMTLPGFVALGAGYQFGDLFASFEVDYTMWSTYDRLEVDIDTGDDDEALDYLEIVNDWEDAFAFRLATEYALTDQMPLRFGIAYDMTPIPDETVNASLPDNDRIVGSLGIGYTWKGMRTDVGYSLVQALEREITNDRAPHGSYTTTGNVFGVNVGYGY